MLEPLSIKHNNLIWPSQTFCNIHPGTPAWSSHPWSGGWDQRRRNPPPPGNDNLILLIGQQCVDSIAVPLFTNSETRTQRTLIVSWACLSSNELITLLSSPLRKIKCSFRENTWQGRWWCSVPGTMNTSRPWIHWIRCPPPSYYLLSIFSNSWSTNKTIRPA